MGEANTGTLTVEVVSQLTNEVASSQVLSATDRLGQAIDEHDALIEGLFTRLGTVLLPEMASVGEDGKIASDPPRRSPLATDLDCHAGRVVEQNERLAALLRRLDV